MLSWLRFAEDVAYMRLLARFAYILTLGEVDLMPVARDPKTGGHPFTMF